ncbi:hypothetical protein [Amycolatopsis kentuckyensis]|uniref:hypothetical protein n=1 Tax=Amycolatopsis kentuckyensis TaxID=218823 RepID=UPI00356ACA20
MSSRAKRYSTRIILAIAVLVPAGLLLPSTAIAAPRKVSYADAVPGLAPPGAPGVGGSGKDSRTPEALVCTPDTYADNPHLSSTPGVISGHGTASGIYPGGGSANRSAANRPCDSQGQAISWRNRVDVDVEGEWDTSEVFERQADVSCVITGADQ